MQIYVHKNNEQRGPYTEEEIKAQLAAGQITLLDHVWWQGQANWLPLGETPLVSPAGAAIPVPAPHVPLPASPAAMSTTPATSQLAIWSLVCACASILCGFFTCIPAIILGHLALSEIKKKPGMQGRGIAMAGTIIGYGFVALFILAIVVLMSLGNQVQDIFKTINSQIAAQAAAQAANNSDDSSTNSSDSNTNSPTATPTNQ